MTKEEFITRPGDINLGKWWNEMRRKQRELDWQQYKMNLQLAQSECRTVYDWSSQGIWNLLFGQSEE